MSRFPRVPFLLILFRKYKSSDIKEFLKAFHTEEVWNNRLYFVFVRDYTSNVLHTSYATLLISFRYSLLNIIVCLFCGEVTTYKLYFDSVLPSL